MPKHVPHPPPAPEQPVAPGPGPQPSLAELLAEYPALAEGLAQQVPEPAAATLLLLAALAGLALMCRRKTHRR